MSNNLHLWRVTSGWDGPFQYEDVLVAAPSIDEARLAAEASFEQVTQPICRARMRLFDLGPVTQGAFGSPRRGGENYGSEALKVPERCDAPTPG